MILEVILIREETRTKLKHYAIIYSMHKHRFLMLCNIYNNADSVYINHAIFKCGIDMKS